MGETSPLREARAASGRSVRGAPHPKGGDGAAGGHQRCSGKRIFPGGMPDLRRVADEREPGADLRSVPGFICSGAETCLRRLRAAAAGVCERAGICAERGAGAALPGVPGQNVCVRTGTKLCGVRRRAGTSNPAAEIRADRAVGGWFAERLAEVVKEQGSALAADVVVPDGCTGSGNASAGITRRRCSPSRGRRNSDCHIKLCC